MEEIVRLDKQMNRFDERLRQTEVRLERNNTLTEASNIAMEKMSNTMDSVKTTMCQLSNQIEQSNRIGEVLSKNVDSLGCRLVGLEGQVNEKIEAVSERIEKIDDKTKVDFAEFIKENLLKFLISGGIIGSCIGVTQYFFK